MGLRFLRTLPLNKSSLLIWGYFVTVVTVVVVASPCLSSIARAPSPQPLVVSLFIDLFIHSWCDSGEAGGYIVIVRGLLLKDGPIDNVCNRKNEDSFIDYFTDVNICGVGQGGSPYLVPCTLKYRGYPYTFLF